MKISRRASKIIYFITLYIVIFLSISFVVTSCIMLFLHGVNLGEAIVRERAPKAFLNIFILTAMFTAVGMYITHFREDLKVGPIVDAANKVARGDHSIRLNYKEKKIPGNYDFIYKSFNEMVEQLSATETLQTDFISNVSHEMKTPLAVIQNYCTLLQMPGLTEQQRTEYTKVIFENTQRITDLVTNILKLNKLENQKIEVEKHIFDIGESVSESLLNFEQLWENKNIEIQTDIRDEVFVNSDKALLSLVWNNLISNALKFTDANGTVKVIVSIENGNAIVRISDTGCGISPETGQHIFEKFYQGDTSHQQQGNGLGLALVKKVVDITGGEIGVESEVGKGSTFTFMIPAYNLPSEN